MRRELELWRAGLRVAGCAVLIAGAALQAQGCAAYLRAVAKQASVMRGAHKLMVFGGPDHATYLGCLTCYEPARDSVFTGSGSSDGRGGPSVVNAGSVFVSPYSQYSACDPFAADPPVVVDEQGTYYGRLTINHSRSDGPPTDALRAWLDRVCAAIPRGP